jgi:hypothetical protein
MPVKNYLCSKCGVLIKSKSTPQTCGCENGENFHSWRDLGVEGDKGFYCKSCLILVHTKDTPTKLGCPSQGFHVWENLF